MFLTAAPEIRYDISHIHVDMLSRTSVACQPMSKSQRNKGAGGERELCGILSDALGQVVKRKLGQARDSGHDIDLPPFRIEVKRRRRIGNLYDWMRQADGGNVVEATFTTDKTTIKRSFAPVVALRGDDEDWLVVMTLDDWIKLAREEIAK